MKKWRLKGWSRSSSTHCQSKFYVSFLWILKARTIANILDSLTFGSKLQTLNVHNFVLLLVCFFGVKWLYKKWPKWFLRTGTWLKNIRSPPLTFGWTCFIKVNKLLDQFWLDWTLKPSLLFSGQFCLDDYSDIQTETGQKLIFGNKTVCVSSVNYLETVM